MNEKNKKIAQGVFLSFVPLSLFIFFVCGFQFLSNMALASLSGNKDQGIVMENENTAQGGVENTGGDRELDDAGNELLPKDDSAPKKDPELKSAISIETDLNEYDKVIFEKSSDMLLPVASLTKLVSAIICFENYDLSDRILVSKKADSQPPMHTDIKEGDIFSVEELLNIMLVESSNKAAYALSEPIGEKEFVLMMNERAADIGMMNSSFADPTGLSSYNISTARDLVILAKYILKNYPQIAQITIKQSYKSDGLGEISNTNKILSEFGNVVLGKTGFTNYANGCLLTALVDPENNDYIINVVLGADDRFLEMRKIINSQKPKEE